MIVSASFEEFSPPPASFAPITDGYLTLRWPGFEVFDASAFPEDSRFRIALVSGKNAAWVRSRATITADQPFDLQSLWISGTGGSPVYLTPWRGETRLSFVRVIPPENGAPQHIVMPLQDLTRLEIQAYGEGVVIDDIELALPRPSETITFEQLPPGVVTNGYWQLRWSGFDAVDAASAPEDSLERRALVSGRNVAVLRNARSTITSGRPFALRSLWMTALATSTVTITADNISRAFTIEPRPTLVDLDFERVTSVTIDAPARQVAIDDIEVAVAGPTLGLIHHPHYERGPMYFPPNLASTVVSDDFNGDGKNDLAMSGQIELALGAGRFETRRTPDRVGRPATTGDYTGDGRPDVLAREYRPAYFSFDDAGVLRQADFFSSFIVFGEFGAARNWLFTTGDDALTGDFNQDGRLDYISMSGSSLTVHRNIGAGQFTAAAQINAGAQLFSFVPLDYDHDGDLDLAVPLMNQGTIAIRPNDAAGNFAAPLYFPTGLARPKNIAARDMNGDGLLDLIVRSAMSEVSVLPALREGGFAAPIPIAGAASVEEGPIPGRLLAVNDLNQDGTPDIAFLSATEIVVLFNKTPPPLRITRIGDVQEIRWLNDFANGATLETATSLEGPWHTHQFPPLLIGAERVAYDSGLAPLRLFRLRP